jgi:hypothetical protein
VRHSVVAVLHSKRLALALALVALVAACSSDSGTNEAANSSTFNSAPVTTLTNPYPDYHSAVYDGTTNWICHPGIAQDECAPKPETVVDASGQVTERPAAPLGDRPIDCFYIYPTVSTDPGVNSDLQPDTNERATVSAQVARYSRVCRVFAPAYRQITLAGLAAGLSGGVRDPNARKIAYGDVVDAWKTYMSQDNQGRGVVLIGHSQGTGLLVALMKQEIDPQPAVRDHVVSAILMGGTVGVPQGKLVGGDFQNLPGCASADQTGCVISFSSFPEAQPPPADSLFGRDPGPGLQALCVNPAQLAGGDGLADAVVPRDAPLIAGNTAAGLPGTGAYVMLPKVLSAQCTRVDDKTVLSYAPASPTDKRDTSKLLEERLGPTWGLHLNDANLPQDDLIEIVGRQAATWAASPH